MWIYLTDSTSLAESGESASPLVNGSDQSPIAKSTHIVKECSFPEWPTELLRIRLSGIMLPRSTEETAIPLLTSYMEAFHARTSALQERERDWKESEADYFSRSLGCLARLSQDSSFWKMSQQSLLEEEPKWSDKLPRWGMIVDGALYPLRPLERYTKGNDGFCWPTPQARNQIDTPSERKRHTPCLHSAILMATPTASQANKPIRAPSPSRMKGEHGEDLQDSIGRLNPENIGKRLSVEFVELLMGYNSTWTALNPSATAWFLSKRKKRLKS